VRGVHAVDLVSDVGQGSTADLPIQDRRLGPRLGTSRHRLLPAPMLRGTSGRFWSLIAVCWWIMGVNRGLASRRPRLKPVARLHGRPRATTCHLEPVFGRTAEAPGPRPVWIDLACPGRRRSEPTDALQPAGLRHVSHRARLGARPGRRWLHVVLDGKVVGHRQLVRGRHVCVTTSRAPQHSHSMGASLACVEIDDGSEHRGVARNPPKERTLIDETHPNGCCQRSRP